MSVGFDILIVPNKHDTEDPIGFYIRLLNSIMESDQIRAMNRVTVYRGQSPIEYGPESKDPHIVLIKEFDEGASVKEAANTLSGLQGNDLYFSTIFTYDRWTWNNELGDCRPSMGWLDLQQTSIEFERGYRYKMVGPYQLHFDDMRYFTSQAIDFNKFEVSGPEALGKLVKYGNNVALMENVVSRIISQTRPEHLVVVTEGDRVNPVNFHLVYHARLSGYLFDVCKILQLHELGGGYFYEGCAGYHDKAYKALGAPSLVYSDKIRTASKAVELAEQLMSCIDAIGVPKVDHLYIADEVIFQIITSCMDVNVETVNSDIYLRHANFLLGYLELPYLRLIEEIIAKQPFTALPT